MRLEKMDVKLGLYDSKGRKVSTGKVTDAQRGTVLIAPADLPAGTYKVRMSIKPAKGTPRKGKGKR